MAAGQNLPRDSEGNAAQGLVIGSIGGKGASKRGSPELRRTLFLVMSVLLQKVPPDDPVFRFLDKKRAEGKLYYVYMTAGNTLTITGTGSLTATGGIFGADIGGGVTVAMILQSFSQPLPCSKLISVVLPQL